MLWLSRLVFLVFGFREGIVAQLVSCNFSPRGDCMKTHDIAQLERGLDWRQVRTGSDHDRILLAAIFSRESDEIDHCLQEI
jgi:hypothetical protein